MIKLSTLVILFVVAACGVNAESNADIVNKKVERTIDLTTHLVRTVTQITVENKGSSPLASYTYAVEPLLANSVAFIGAEVANEKNSDEVDELKVTQLKSSDKGALFKIDFKKPVASGKSQQFEVEVVFINAQRPYPTEITQNDRQLVLFKGSSLYYSLYQTTTQTTKVNLASDKVESFTQHKPTAKADQTITYGPYENVQKPFEFNEIQIHYENNSPFLTVSQMTRTIEISHWGNIAVEETIDMYHSGAALKGPFSRFDYMRRIGGASSVKSFKTLLPASANSVYYRDEIGNISTSNLRYALENAELELRPRFPLFGGWRTHYTIGYNVPSYQYLFNRGSQYKLAMKFIDHVFDDQLIERLTVKIILPEHSSDIKFTAPSSYDVKEEKRQLHYTYLDTVGRPVVVLTKTNVVDNHIEDFELTYTFQKFMILKEPFLVAGAFYLLFTLVIILVRFDFSITKDSAQDARLRVKAYWEQIIKQQEKREGLYDSYNNAIDSYKSSKGGKPSLDQRKKVETDLKQIAADLDALSNKLKAESADTAEKISQLNQLDGQLLDNYAKHFEFAQKVVQETLKREDYLEQKKKIDEKTKQINEKIQNILAPHL